MLSPILRERDEAIQGATYIRYYNTGTLDTTDMTPRVTMQHKSTLAEVAGAVQMARLSVGNNPETGLPYDSRYDWAMVISKTVTSTLGPGRPYFINVGFDNLEGQTIPHGRIDLSVLPGVPQP